MGGLFRAMLLFECGRCWRLNGYVVTVVLKMYPLSTHFMFGEARRIGHEVQ